MALSVDSVREQLRAVVDGRLPIGAFEDWLTAGLPGTPPGATSVRQLVTDLQALSVRVVDETTLRLMWRDVLRRLDVARRRGQG